MSDRHAIEQILAASANRTVLIENLLAYIKKVRGETARPHSTVTLQEPEDAGEAADATEPKKPYRFSTHGKKHQS